MIAAPAALALAASLATAPAARTAGELVQRYAPTHRPAWSMPRPLLSHAPIASTTSVGEPKPPIRIGPSPPPRDAVRAGGDLYALHCIHCHGADLRGTPMAPGLTSSGAASVDFQLSTGRMPLEVPGTEPMRGPPSFSRDQIDALVAYVTTHGGHGDAIPHLHHSADLTRGRVLYENDCQACHGATGDGAVAGFGWLAPSLKSSISIQVAEAVRVGPGIMPRFNDRELPPADLDALVAYVEALHRPDDRGGYSLASAGPVGEGLVGWIVGVGACALVMLAVGETLRKR